MKISLIAAIAEGNRAIGYQNKLIFHLSEDLKRFKKLTQNHPVIMGRKTFESIGHPLAHRTNIVITNNLDYPADGIIVAHSLAEALKLAEGFEGSDEIFIIGGAQIYQQAITLADKLYLTLVPGSPQADAFFPPFQEFKEVVFEQLHQEKGLQYKFLDLEKSGS